MFVGGNGVRGVYICACVFVSGKSFFVQLNFKKYSVQTERNFFYHNLLFMNGQFVLLLVGRV